ncbi:MAG: sigma 54-interacting transcriptional regulator [Gemmatimonadota bacterium]|nr:MAG: sigma 54-interacting transcriptional regulator [Gemmatimonadota bacterium]
MSAGDTGEFVVRADEPTQVGRKSREQLLSELEVLEVQFEASREARMVLQRAEEALRKSEERLRKFFEHSHDALFVFDPVQDVILEVNPRACELLGYTREELLALPVSAVHPGELPRFQEFVRSVLRDGSGWTDEVTCLTKDHTQLAAEISASAVVIEGRRRVIAWVRDVTQRKEAEAKLKESEERFRRLVERAADAFYVIEQDGRIVDVNQQAADSTGYDRDALGKMWVWEIWEGFSPERLRRNLEEIERSGPTTLCGYHRRRDGTRFPVEVRTCLLEERGTRRVLALARDISERVEAEEERRKLNLERVYLQEEIEMEHNFGEIVGGSRAIKKLFQEIERVAATDSTVLITGETGTGKELVARAIHGASARRDRVLIKVNCAALSSGLIESELFGHEKGAFTGATQRRVGRFELADGGSIFLDEIGDLPAELQVKLLRVLQDGEFERVGGSKSIRVDVRVMAATNRDLERAVEQQRFRSDLYFRLKVYPIHVPALRDRTGDIPVLVNFLAQKYAKRMGKTIQTVPQRAMNALKGYAWPGNVRELENVIERGVIVSPETELELGEWLRESGPVAEEDALLTLDEVQRRHIVSALEHTGWRVSGPNGAARVLGMKPTTLQARMKKLGISRGNRG